ENNGQCDTYITLDNNNSGARLAWDFFHPDTPPPMVIKHIDDRDRWQFKMRGSREIHLALQSELPWTFEKWAQLTHPDNYDSLYSAGATLLKDQTQKVAHSAKKATPVKIPVTLPDLFEGACVEGLVVNTPTFISEVGHELAVKSGTFGLVWYYDGESGRANCSLRSNGDYDVSAIAKLFGGGGHLNASGFNIDMPTLLEWMKG
ncbi:MAG TPA: DHHA1 domain-containing protein, partial [Aquabacterium sp.]|nr:DHHA1 domain-containing protein [Aquabacterium sp.]